MGSGGVPELVSLSISAWSLKARFALKYNGIKYRTTPYMPLFGEFKLRLRLWEWRRKLTVPVMFTSRDGVLLQSYDIARWADSHTERPEAGRLFPTGFEDEIKSWNGTSDEILFFARQALTEELLADPAALWQHVPPGLRWMGPLAVALVRMILLRLKSKYRVESSTSSLTRVLELLRGAQAALRASSPTAALDGERHLVGNTLTYADVAMAVAAQVIKPLGPPYTSSPRPGLKELQPYQEEFVDLVEWRDAIFAKHFPHQDDKKSK